jgi:sugar lactone lactonase YvrE
MSVQPERQWDVVVPSACEIGERPLWDIRTGTFVWVDIPTGTMHRTTVGGPLPWPTTSQVLGQNVGVAVLREVGGTAVAVDGRIVFLNEDGQEDAAPLVIDMPHNTMFNDGMCDPAGRLLVGTTSDPAGPPNGVLFSIDTDLTVRTVLSGIFESNGLDWSLDGTIMYYVDSFESVVRRYEYDVETGAVGQRLSDLVALPSEKGISDGLIVDTDDAIWLALWEGSAIHRYSPDGELLDELRAPISKLTCPALVGPDLDILVVTSAWQDLTAEQRESEPWAGHVITTPVNARGRLPFRFGGRQV